jgi:hypothetical protein
MMIGVAQVIGMKPTLRSFFSSGPPSANASVAELRERCGRGCRPHRFQERAARDIARKHRPHYGGSDHALVALLLALDRSLKLHGRLVLGFADMQAAVAAARTKSAVGIERVVECGHQLLPVGAVSASRSAIAVP